jgi:hypothetical protein
MRHQVTEDRAGGSDRQTVSPLVSLVIPNYKYLRRALRIDNSLATDVDLFYDIAMNPRLSRDPSAPSGFGLEARAQRALHMAEDLLGGPDGRLALLRQDLVGTVLHGFGLAAYNSGLYALGRRFLLGALRRRPILWTDATVVGDVMKSLVCTLLCVGRTRRDDRPHGG